MVMRPGLPARRYCTDPLFMPRRLVCAAGCGATAGWEAPLVGRALVGVTMGGTEDPCFGRPLWLQTRCAGRVLWAYNEEHVGVLAGYVGAQLRERGSSSSTGAMIPRLPHWMKRAENRTDVLAGLDRLRDLAGRSAPEERSDAAYVQGEQPREQRNVYFGGGSF
ncbi:hypothetical protein GCM10010329_32950 [Streptomyces spiroverticillatus]|nr:hypothetical protein GCM10010329_32950 [Streptomyces spiroverticillatus]